MEYIPVEKLLAEIERYENTAIEAYNPIGEDADYWHGKVNACEDVKAIAASLQQEQPEVDFETEYAKFSNDPDELDYAFPIDLADYKDFARHFFELGLNARKEESVGVAESPSKTFPRVNEFDFGSSYRH